MYRPVKKSLRHHIKRGIARIRLLFKEEGGYISRVAHRPGPTNSGESLVVISANLWHDWPLFLSDCVPNAAEDAYRLIENFCKGNFIKKNNNNNNNDHYEFEIKNSLPSVDVRIIL